MPPQGHVAGNLYFRRACQADESGKERAFHRYLEHY
jgi:hypothetical protein